VHFFPLTSVLCAPLIRWLGVTVTTVSIAGLLAGVLSDIAPSTVTGTGAGVALLGSSLLMLVGPARRDAQRVTVPALKAARRGAVGPVELAGIEQAADR